MNKPLAEKGNNSTIEALKSILSNNKNKNNQSYLEDRPIKEQNDFCKENNQNFDLEKYVKSNFAEIFEKINELNKMATHLVKQNEKNVEYYMNLI